MHCNPALLNLLRKYFHLYHVLCKCYNSRNKTERKGEKMLDKRKKKKYPWRHLLQTALHKMNETAGKVPITTLPTTHPTIKKILRFIRQKKLAEPLSGEKFFNGNIDR